MSRKINVRSPFFLNLDEPVVPLPEFTCSTAFPRGLDDTGFAIDNQGVVTNPSPAYGVFISITSTDGDYSNGKYATVTSDTVRSVVARVRIPAGFSNTSAVYKDCTISAIQPGLTTSVVEPTPCTPSVTTSGSISSVSLDSGGSSTTIDLSGYFNGETIYHVSNPNPTLVSTSISGSNLIISSNVIGGSGTVYAIARDGSYPTTCEAVQPISVTVNVVGAPTADCDTSPLTGGGIDADGNLTLPSTTFTINTPYPSTSANTTGSSRTVTLTFSLTVPSGYANAGATLSCDKDFIQPAQNITPDFSCTIAGLTGQSISKNGAIYKGSAAEGTIASFSPVGFDTVTSDTSRLVTFTITIPSGYNNAGQTITCDKTLIQPASVGDCGLNQFYITTGRPSPGSFCDGTYATSVLVNSTATTLPELMGTKICKNGTPFNGGGLYYGVLTGYIVSAVGVGVGNYYVIQIDSTGIVLSVEIHRCDDTGGDGQGSILL